MYVMFDISLKFEVFNC